MDGIAMNLEAQKIGFIGFGRMAQVLFKRLVSSDLIKKHQIFFNEKQASKVEQISKYYKIEPISLQELNKRCSLILICVLPQNIKEVVNDIRNESENDNLYISILAGTKIKNLQKALSSKAKIMRALPNIASSIGEGITPICFNSKCTTDIKTLGTLLFTSLGIVLEISEKLMDVVCGICGCVPAFVFKMIDEIAKLGVEQGLSYEMSLKLTAQAFAGSAKLIQKEKKADSLIESVKSPNGAAVAGLKNLEKLNLLAGLKETVKISIQRSSELSNI
jgi:pyrroline-5-carboxylate reductase